MPLYAYQEEIRTAILAGKSIILQAPTGAGKTRAALAPFIENYFNQHETDFPKKCIYSVPMRVLANQFSDEYSTYSETYERRFNRKIKVCRQTGEYKEDPEFGSDLIFATIDQLLSGWLLHPYSLSKRKGNINAGAFVGSYLIFDEFHLFDPDSTMPTTLHMLKTLKGVSPFILMTATFSADMLQELATHLDAEPFLLTPDQLQDIAAQQKTRYYYTVAVPLATDVGANIDLVIEQHLNQPKKNQRSLVVCNQVERSQRVYKQLVSHPSLPETVEVILLHSRFLKADRQEIEAMVRQEFHRNHDKHTLDSVILIGTQTVEVGLDMSCAALHTEIAPAASVLQRAGRCARYKGEVGHVYVYPVFDEESKAAYAPYHGLEAKKQCLLTWEWLQNNQNKHIDFAAEQTLINHAHTPTDKRILEGLKGTSSEHKKQIVSIWNGEGNKSDANRLVRDIQSVSIVVHANPDQLAHAPFKAESFSLFPGTLKGKYHKWQEAIDSLDPDFDEGYISPIAQYLEEVEDDNESQNNRPVNYRFVPVKHNSQLSAPLVAIHPALVSYSKKTGLMFDGSGGYETPVPHQLERIDFSRYGYKLESYERHIELVYQAFLQDSSKSLKKVGRRLENRFGWPLSCVHKMAEAIIALHDVGKLSSGWQDWATTWQSSSAVNRPVPSNTAVAHTDYDPNNSQQATLNKQMRRQRPHHAVESAVASHRLLIELSPDKKADHPLVRAAFSAIARHHAPFSSEIQDYRLVKNYPQHITNTLDLIGVSTQALDKIPSELTASKAQRAIEDLCLIKATNPADILCYMVFVRALRLADQKGTAEGSK